MLSIEEINLKVNDLEKQLFIANKELAFQNDEKEKRADELVVANKELAFQNDEKEKRADELVVANKELAFQNDEKEKRADELVVANKELAFQNDEKEKRADELVIANKELAFQNDEKEKRADELVIANKELAFQNDEKEKRADELVIANKELAFQNDEKEKRADELVVANKELAFQNDEKEKRADELVIANKELAFQNDEKEKRADELVIANKELAFQNDEKEKRADELVVANKELAFQNDEKEKRADELVIANKELARLNNRTLEDLEQAGNIFGNIIASAPIPIMIHAEDGTVLNLSEKWTDLTKYSKSDIPTIFEWTKKAYGKNKEEVQDFISKLYKLTVTQHDGEFIVTTKDGRNLTWDFNSSCIGRLPDGRAVAMSVAVDVTERLAKEEETLKLMERSQKTETLLKASLESPKDMVVLAIDNEYNYNYFNQNHKEVMFQAYGTNIKINDNLFDQISSEDDRLKAKEIYDRALAGETFSMVESWGMNDKIFFESFYYPIFDADKLVIGASVFARDITKRTLEQQELKDSFDRLDRSQRISNVGSWELDLETKTIWGSEEAFNIYGLHRDNEYLDATKLEEMITSDDKEMLGKALSNLVENDEPYNVIFKLNIGNKKKHIHSKAIISRDSLGKPIKVLGVIRDTTEYDVATKKHEDSEMKYKLLVDMNPIGMIHYQIVYNAENKMNDFLFLGINRVFEKLLGMSSSELIGKNLWEVFPQTEQYWIDQYNKVALTEETVIFEDYSTVLDQYLKVTAYKVDADIMAVLIEDVTEIKKKQKEILFISYHDSLTNLYNRRYYEDNIHEMDIPENYPLTIIMSDINGLKLINDAFGHKAGDTLLISATKVITDSCRETDLVARIGGDEFIIVMPNTSGIEADKIINKINKNASAITVESIELSIAFGYATKSQDTENIHDTFRSAEDLMYRVKLLEIPSMRSGAIETILNTLYEKDKNSEIHSRTVSEISEKIASVYGMNRQEVNEVKTAGLLHDIGKIIIPISIIVKEGKLTPEEYELIKSHSEIGFRILNSTHDMRNISNIVLSHHERWDGLGYPRGLKAIDIPIQSRIISIADAFDAMTSARTYREIFTNEEALDEIINNAGSQFDPELAKIFEKHFFEIIVD